MSAIAPILEQSLGKICFGVDDVQQAEKPLPVQNSKSQIEKQFKKPTIAFSHDETFETIELRSLHELASTFYIHPLALAVHSAFSEHRPLLLTPDIIWIAIAQGFAQHINNHAEALRSYFVSHFGKKALTVESLQFPQKSQDWVDIIQQWSLKIRDAVGTEIYQLLECNFSTTTPITRTASQIVMMDAFQQYFDYVLLCICGIPHVTLLGTVADWQSIYDRVEAIATYDLSWWTNRLLPICQELIETASGKPSLEFWRTLYKPKLIYASDTFTGWLTDFFPYLKHPQTKIPSIRNPILSIDRSQLTVKDGISLASLPSGISQVTVKLVENKTQHPLELQSGFMGVSQNLDSGVLQPEIGWWVCQGTSFAELLDRIEREHEVQTPIDWSEFRGDTIPKEIMQLRDRFDGAILYPNFDRSWEIVKHGDVRTYFVPDLDVVIPEAEHFINLIDGRCIAYTYQWRIGRCWIVVGQPISCPNSSSNWQLENIKIIATSIPQLLDRIFQAEGRYYFDDSDFVPDEI